MTRAAVNLEKESCSSPPRVQNQHFVLQPLLLIPIFACEGIFFFFLLLLNDFDLAPFCNFLSVFCCFSGSVCCIIVGTHSRKCRLIRSATAVIAETLRCRNH